MQSNIRDRRFHHSAFGNGWSVAALLVYTYIVHIKESEHGSELKIVAFCELYVVKHGLITYVYIFFFLCLCYHWGYIYI